MKFVETKIPEVIIIEPKIWKDDRGSFFESFRQDLFDPNSDFWNEHHLAFMFNNGSDEQEISKINFIQDNESFSTYGTLRGLHYQLPPFAQSKLVRVVYGKALDIAVDIRKHSPTFGKHISVELSSENKKQFFFSRGFAHGFLTLSETAIFQYKVDNYYNKESEAGIIWNDKKNGIDWGVEINSIKLSQKDEILPFLEDAKLFDSKLGLYD